MQGLGLTMEVAKDPKMEPAICSEVVLASTNLKVAMCVWVGLPLRCANFGRKSTVGIHVNLIFIFMV